jgi:hypothetical protein
MDGLDHLRELDVYQTRRQHDRHLDVKRLAGEWTAEMLTAAGAEVLATVQFTVEHRDDPDYTREYMEMIGADYLAQSDAYLEAASLRAEIELLGHAPAAPARDIAPLEPPREDQLPR